MNVCLSFVSIALALIHCSVDEAMGSSLARALQKKEMGETYESAQISLHLQCDSVSQEEFDMYSTRLDERISRIESQPFEGVSMEDFEAYKQQQETRISQLEQKINYVNPCFLMTGQSTGEGAGTPFSDLEALHDSGYAKPAGFGYSIRNSVAFGDYIGCFGIQYGNVPAVCHGETVDDMVMSVGLDSDEFIIGISGRSGSAIDKLTVITNKRTHGPYGDQGGGPFFIEAHGSHLAYMEGTVSDHITSLKPIFYC